jgi:hypothetical protein
MLVALRSPVRLQPRAKPAREDFAFLEKRFTPRTVFMEIGASDSTLAVRAATYVERVYAIDVAGRFLQAMLLPLNLRIVPSDGASIRVPASSVDLAWGGEFVDQLQPDAAAEHLKSVHACLVKGGEYLCETQSFEKLRERLLAAGFSSVACSLGGSRIPWALRRLFPQHLLRISAIK